MIGGFETRLEGEPASVQAAAEWLDSLQAALDTSGGHVGTAHFETDQVWTGDAADGYRLFSAELLAATTEIRDRAASAWDRFLSYKQQLEWAQEDLASVRRAAVINALTVTRTFVEMPPPGIAPRLPAEPTSAQQGIYNREREAYEALLERQDTYTRLEADAAEIRRNLNAWIIDYLIPEEGLALQPSRISEYIADAGTAAPGIGLSVISDRTQQQALRDASDAHYQRAYERAVERSDNPGVRAGVVEPSDAAVERNSGRIPSGDVPLLAARSFGITGAVLDTVLVVDELASGASPSQVAVEQGAGWAASATMAAALATAGIGGPVTIIIAAGLAGTFTEYGAGEIYQNAVPQHRREAADRWVYEVW